MILFQRKRKLVEGLMADYRHKVRACLKEYQRCIHQYCASDDLDALKEEERAVHRLESEADDIRREIEDMLYAKVLFPESRGDLLALLELLDKMPNHAQHTVRSITTQQIKIPEAMQSRFCELVEISTRCVNVTLDASEKIFQHLIRATAITGRIDELESEADRIEMALLEQIFSSDWKDLDKILLRDLVRSASAICDKAETAGDRMRIIVAKRLM